MKYDRSRLLRRMSASLRRRTLRKTENKLINRRQVLFLQSIDGQEANRAS